MHVNEACNATLTTQDNQNVWQTMGVTVQTCSGKTLVDLIGLRGACSAYPAQ